MFRDKNKNVYTISSYLYEIFRLDDTYDAFFNISNTEQKSSISFEQFSNAHYPMPPYLIELETILLPFLKNKKLVASIESKYNDLLDTIERSDKVDDLTQEQKSEIESSKKMLPSVMQQIKETSLSLKKSNDTLMKEFDAIQSRIQSEKQQNRTSCITAIHAMLHNLGLPPEQYKDKKIDNPIDFISYYEAADFIRRQTSLQIKKIPVKHWETAQYDYQVFNRLKIFLAFYDCVAPLGISYN